MGGLPVEIPVVPSTVLGFISLLTWVVMGVVGHVLDVDLVSRVGSFFLIFIDPLFFNNDKALVVLTPCGDELVVFGVIGYEVTTFSDTVHSDPGLERSVFVFFLNEIVVGKPRIPGVQFEIVLV